MVVPFKFKELIMRYIKVFFVLIFICKSYSQNHLFIKSELVSIREDYVLELKDLDNNLNYWFRFYDLQPNEKYRDSINDYLKKALEDVFYVTPEIESGGVIDGWILYNCQITQGLTPDDQIPCSSGNPLNIELIKKTYFRYVGDDNFLKNITGN